MTSNMQESDQASPASDSVSEEEDSGMGFQSNARRVPRVRQFQAVLWKNYLLQTRASKAWYSFGAVGWIALLIQVAIPGIFFALTCIPKHFVQPQHIPQQLSRISDLDGGNWASTYNGPASFHDMRAVLAYAPNTSSEQAIMEAFRKSVSCPDDPVKKVSASRSFYSLFRQPLQTPECADQFACLGNPACSSHLYGPQIVGFGSEKEAVSFASDRPDTVDAVVYLQDSEDKGKTGYTLRVNHTEIPSTRAKLNMLDVAPSTLYQNYWLFANLQLHLDRAIIGHAMDPSQNRPAVFNVKFKPFPWPAFVIDYAAAAASLAFNLLLVFAFLVPTQGIVSTIVREKELRLREGMRIFGLKDLAYWGSWAISHFATLAMSMFICALVSLYPFPNSSFSELLILLLLIALALIAFAYAISTLFSKSRIGGIATPMLYLVAMVPGYLMPTFQPYGGWGWYLSCLFPPSAVSLFAHVLLKAEAGGQGLQWQNISASVTSESDFPFSAKVVFIAIIFDIVFYSLLATYLDKVIPSDIGANLPWNFPLKGSYWRSHKKSDKKDSVPLLHSPRESDSAMIRIQNLHKVFPTTDGYNKVAVDNLNINMQRNEITGLLGTNGAGKTTTISILTGMLKPTSGTAFVNGLSIQDDMSAIRQNLGVCPQFDILWPDLTVREHLELYAAIKGYSKIAGKLAAENSAKEVGLEEKLDSEAENLSGGQRRKLSVAIAFLGSPGFVILDEPTSGMDPHSRRFTWEVIKRNKAGHAIILTTHSMEEADLLCDKINIMNEGELVAQGSSLDLKRQFGVGYMLTVVKERGRNGQDNLDTSNNRKSEDDVSQLPVSSPHPSVSQLSVLSDSDTELEQIIQDHIPNAQSCGRGASEIMFRLPKDDRRKFPALFRDLDKKKQDLNIKGYGLAETTLEEVFLAATKSNLHPDRGGKNGEADTVLSVEDENRNDSSWEENIEEERYEGDERRSQRSTGGRLYLQQVWAMFVKRAISAKRDRMAMWNQLAVPILLVLVALISGKTSSKFPQEPSLPISRKSCEFGAHTVFGASVNARSNTTAYKSFVDAYHFLDIEDSGESKLWNGPIFVPAKGTLDQYLLDHWGDGLSTYDAVFFDQWANTQQIVDLNQSVDYTILVNQTAIHAMPAIINSVSSALLRTALGQHDANLPITNHPLPTLSHEVSIEVSREIGDILLVLYTIMSSALISASFALFLVREKESSSKNVQMISGAFPTAFWLSTAIWDALSFCVPALGILILYAIFRVPQFLGQRFSALTVLLFMFGAASVPLTYLLSFAFKDEMKALQRISTLFFLSGFLGFMATWILDIVYLVTHTSAVKTSNIITKRILRLIFPHFNLARGMYEVSQTHSEMGGDKSPWTWITVGQWVAFFALQAVVYMLLTILVEEGWFELLGYQIRRLLSPFLSCIPGFRNSDTQSNQEDDDVARERYRIQDAQGKTEDQVVSFGLEKSYTGGCCKPGTKAVQGVSFGVNQGECFGLLGVNGAGKTTTFKILTGEVKPDNGEATICDIPVLENVSRARQNLGYCPQFSGLPLAMTGREVLRLYARLRGMPNGLIEHSIQSLITRLDLTQYADRACDSYSGGNKRKLSVGISLVGGPPVVMLDEPSTGMDPGAKRFLWDLIEKQVVGRGHTVLLTSHSMEECEALCSKIAIMRAGKLQCFGSVQHLKNKFGAGYILEIRVPSESQYSVKSALQNVCTNAELTVSANSWMTYRLPQDGLDLADLFQTLEELKQWGVQEYSLSQTTLEHVFVHLAQQPSA